MTLGFCLWLFTCGITITNVKLAKLDARRTTILDFTVKIFFFSKKLQERLLCNCKLQNVLIGATHYLAGSVLTFFKNLMSNVLEKNAATLKGDNWGLKNAWSTTKHHAMGNFCRYRHTLSPLISEDQLSSRGLL